MAFKTWSQTNNEALVELKPDFGLISWSQLSKMDKNIIWQYLYKNFFFHDEPNTSNDYYSNELIYGFYGTPYEQSLKESRIESAIFILNHKFKKNSYAKNYLLKNDLFNACKDFYLIFNTQNENVVLELLSLYAKWIIEQDKPETNDNKNKEDEEFKWQRFDFYVQELNEVFSQFGLNVVLSRNGFILKQDEKITNEIYVPVLKFFSNIQWKEVNLILAECFNEYRRNTPQSYSTCVTKTVTAVQAFLQIKVHGKTGKGDISQLLTEAKKKKLIPSDKFTSDIFKNIESILAVERQATGDAHPRAEFANEKNARLVLNLAMIFFQHCL